MKELIQDARAMQDLDFIARPFRKQFAEPTDITLKYMQAVSESGFSDLCPRHSTHAGASIDSPTMESWM
jgi:hypothetical protein